jgi:hypothetical protein
MQKSTHYSELKAAIATLEKEQAQKQLVLKEQFKVTYESLNPFTLIKNSFNSITGSPELRSQIIGIAIPLLAGLFSKKASARTRRASLLAEAGILILDSLNRYVANNPELLQTAGRYIADFFKKKDPGETAED